jgi:hypothetical protein
METTTADGQAASSPGVAVGARRAVGIVVFCVGYFVYIGWLIAS